MLDDITRLRIKSAETEVEYQKRITGANREVEKLAAAIESLKNEKQEIELVKSDLEHSIKSLTSQQNKLFSLKEQYLKNSVGSIIFGVELLNKSYQLETDANLAIQYPEFINYLYFAEQMANRGMIELLLNNSSEPVPELPLQWLYKIRKVNNSTWTELKTNLESINTEYRRQLAKEKQWKSGVDLFDQLVANSDSALNSFSPDDKKRIRLAIEAYKNDNYQYLDKPITLHINETASAEEVKKHGEEVHKNLEKIKSVIFNMPNTIKDKLK